MFYTYLQITALSGQIFYEEQACIMELMLLQAAKHERYLYFSRVQQTGSNRHLSIVTSQ